MTTFKRILLKGTLTTQANFHIGTGKEQLDEEQTRFNQLCLDSKGKPYIPASTLRGYLRSIISQHARDSENDLFGLARQDSKAIETGNSGLVRIYDCDWSSGENNSQLKTQTSIEPVTGTAKHHHLANHAIIPPKSQFNVHLELDNCSEPYLRLILQALQTLGKEYQGKLGKGKSTGQGEIHWQQKSLQVLTKEKLKAWLTQKSKPAKRYKKKENIKPERTIASYFDTAEIEVKPFPSLLTTLKFQLKAYSPILINDPQAVKKLEQESKKIEKDQQITLPPDPDLIYLKQQGYAIIPGSTLKGWVRARARRILLTLLTNNNENQANETIADKLIAQLFGNTQQQGHLTFDDAKAIISDQDNHPQTFTAIDRFTGGVKDGALYNVEAVWPDQPFTGQLYQTKKLQGWMKLLLLYIVKDSMEGDLVLGWGKSKGYGRLQLSQIKQHNNWNDLYLSLQQTELQQWDKELQQKLTEEKDEVS